MIRTLQLIALLTVAMGGTVFDQESHPSPTPETAPPPLRVIPRLERTQIDEADGPKDRLKTTIVLAESHLLKAENLAAQTDFAGASAEIGIYWAMLEDVFGFLRTIKSGSDKARDLYKRIELTLRSHGPRLVAMRRSTPAEYSVWIKQVEEYARNSRTEALNSFYGHTVFREPGMKTPPPTENSQPQKALSATEAKKP